MSEVSEKTAEVVAENVEEAMDEIVEVVEVVRNNPLLLSVVGVLGLAAGAAGGYFVARKFLRAHYAEIAEQEIAEGKEFYASLNKVTVDGEALTPQQVLDQRHGDGAAAAALRGYQGIEVEAPVAEEEELLERRVTEASVESVNVGVEGGPEQGVHPVELVEERQEESRNVFIDPTFDYAEEVKYRTKDVPYVITHDEYFGAEKEYDTIQLTYFEKDDTLVGENDKPIDDLTTINEDNLARFGHGSKDKKIVYVRNDKLQTDYEITLSDQSYLEALGLGPERNELKHSNQRDARRAFRNGEG
jgi:hypothetical protein